MSQVLSRRTFSMGPLRFYFSKKGLSSIGLRLLNLSLSWRLRARELWLTVSARGTGFSHRTKLLDLPDAD